MRDIAAYVHRHRDRTEPFVVATGGATPGDDPARAADLRAAYAYAGLTWWLEYRHHARGDFEAMRTRLRQGPPGRWHAQMGWDLTLSRLGGS